MNLGSKVENSEKEEKKKKGLLDVMFPSKSHLFSASKKSFYLKILYVLKNSWVWVQLLSTMCTTTNLTN